MKIQSALKEMARGRVFPIKISLFEERLLRKEAETQQKTIAALIREGFLHRPPEQKTYEKIIKN